MNLSTDDNSFNDVIVGSISFLSLMTIRLKFSKMCWVGVAVDFASLTE